MGKKPAKQQLKPSEEAEKVRLTLKSLFQQVKTHVESYEKISVSCLDKCQRVAKVTERIEVVSKASANEDGFLVFKDLPDLPNRLTKTLQVAFESKMKDLRQLLDEQRVICVQIAQLCEKGNKSFDRNFEKIGLVETARRTATSPSVTEFVESFNAISRVYLDQWDLNLKLVNSISCENVDVATSVNGKWDGLLLQHSKEIVHIFRTATFVST